MKWSSLELYKEDSADLSPLSITIFERDSRGLATDSR